jgi:hypothetical protein
LFLRLFHEKQLEANGKPLAKFDGASCFVRVGVAQIYGDLCLVAANGDSSIFLRATGTLRGDASRMSFTSGLAGILKPIFSKSGCGVPTYVAYSDLSHTPGDSGIDGHCSAARQGSGTVMVKEVTNEQT